ncbi:MAG: ABC transporter permease [Candidatus Pacebacteria bacterium]|nr:ABC transporter permease [Candidatus Paceibacterota bacterium]
MKLEIIKMSFESLLANKTRTFLSMLGIIIGVSTVIAVFAIGQGAQKAVDEQFQGLSADSIIVMSVKGKIESSKLKTTDSKVIIENCPHIPKATAVIQGGMAVSFEAESGSFNIMGIESNYFEMSSIDIGEGRLITNEDVEGNERVAVLGSEIVETLFFEKDKIIGQTIKINGKMIEVIGIVEETGRSMGKNSLDDAIYLPNTTAEKSILGSNASVMIFTVADGVENIEIASEELVLALREEHGLKDSQEDDFKIMDAGAMVGAAQDSAELMTFLLTSVAAIVLLVSGIGIMNVMFVTVAERTKEIGISKAIGGKQGDILGQFLLESVTLSMVGGLLGIIIGSLAISILSRLDVMALAFSWTGPIIGFCFSVVVGVFFGFYPALKASRLDPVDALRSE